MDEKSDPIIGDCPWEVETIPVDHKLSRQFWVHYMKKTSGGRRFPPESEFKTRDGDLGLSFYWNKYIDLKSIFLTIGLSHKSDSSRKFKDYTGFKIFQIPCEVIISLYESISIVHEPLFNGNPAPIGQPNIRSHTLVQFGEIQEEDSLRVRMNLSEYCVKNHNDSYRHFEVTSIRNEIRQLIESGDNTPFHRI